MGLTNVDGDQLRQSDVVVKHVGDLFPHGMHRGMVWGVQGLVGGQKGSGEKKGREETGWQEPESGPGPGPGPEPGP